MHFDGKVGQRRGFGMMSLNPLTRVVLLVCIFYSPTFGLKRVSPLGAANAGGIARDNSAAFQEQVGQRRGFGMMTNIS